MTTLAIVNRRGARRLKGLNVPVRHTEARGHATELARTALQDGVQTIVAIGGDGTINEIVNGFFDGDRPIAPMARLAIIPAGTGSDFRRSLRIPLDTAKAQELLHTGVPRQIDILHVRYTTREGAPASRYCVNLASFGMGGLVAARVKGSYLTATAAAALGYSGNAVSIRIDDKPALDARITNVAVGNGQYHGGGMWVCPGAILDDGLMDVTVIHYLTLFEIARSALTLYNGGILSHPKVRTWRGRRVEATSPETVMLEIDGEAVGKLPVEISIRPKALWVVAPESPGY